MQKLKKQKINNLLNYQHFLKNNYLKKNKINLKNILFNNPILYQNLDSNIIEFNSYKNIYLPFTLIKINDISTIEKQYENELLFNYDLNYNILYHFNCIMFQNIIQKKKNIIKGRITGGNKNNKKVLISILGILFSMKPLHLNNLLNKYKKNYYFNKKTKKKYYFNRKIKKIKIINNYKLRYINFKINFKNNLEKKQKKSFSRVSYLKEIIKDQKLQQKRLNERKKLIKQKKLKKLFLLKQKSNNKKSVLSRKLYVREMNQKQK